VYFGRGPAVDPAPSVVLDAPPGAGEFGFSLAGVGR
jgi:hypothetical protein